MDPEALLSTSGANQSLCGWRWSGPCQKNLTNSLESTEIDSTTKHIWSNIHWYSEIDNLKGIKLHHNFNASKSLGLWDMEVSNLVSWGVQHSTKHATKLRDVRTSRSKWSLACSTPCSLKTLNETPNKEGSLWTLLTCQPAKSINIWSDWKPPEFGGYQITIPEQLERAWTGAIFWYIKVDVLQRQEAMKAAALSRLISSSSSIHEISMNANKNRVEKKTHQLHDLSLQCELVIHRLVVWCIRILISASVHYHPYRQNTKNHHSDTTLPQSRGHGHVHESWFSVWLDQSQIHDCRCLVRACVLFKVFQSVFFPC